MHASRYRKCTPRVTPDLGGVTMPGHGHGHTPRVPRAAENLGTLVVDPMRLRQILLNLLSDIGFYPGFLRGLAFVDNYAAVTLSLPRHERFQGLALDDELTRRKAVPWCGLLIIDIRYGDVVEWLRFDSEREEALRRRADPGRAVPTWPDTRQPRAAGGDIAGWHAGLRSRPRHPHETDPSVG